MHSAKFMVSVLCLIALTFQGSLTVSSTNAVVTDDYSNVEDVIEQYISSKYDSIAQLTIPLDSIGTYLKHQSKEAPIFQQTEKCMVSSYVRMMLACSDDQRFSIDKLSYSHNYVSIDDTFADVYTCVQCEFEYISSQDIKSGTGEIYHIYLRNEGYGWEIIGREYLSDFDVAFWLDEIHSVENAMERERNISLIAADLVGSRDINQRTSSTHEDDCYSELITGTRTITYYNATGAVNWALNHVAPISSTWNANGGYSYSYPSPYSQFYHDCTNYVSVCMNLGAGIPFDTTGYSGYNGADKWFYYSTATPNSTYSYSWAAVANLGLYLNAGATASDGIYSVNAYQGSSYPATLTNTTVRYGDIVQFYNGDSGSWTHSAIITQYKPAIDCAYICQHDAQSYMSQCSLEGYYI